MLEVKVAVVTELDVSVPVPMITGVVLTLEVVVSILDVRVLVKL